MYRARRAARARLDSLREECARRLGASLLRTGWQRWRVSRADGFAETAFSRLKHAECVRAFGSLQENAKLRTALEGQLVEREASALVRALSLWETRAAARAQLQDVRATLGPLTARSFSAWRRVTHRSELRSDHLWFGLGFGLTKATARCFRAWRRSARRSVLLWGHLDGAIESRCEVYLQRGWRRWMLHVFLCIQREHSLNLADLVRRRNACQIWRSFAKFATAASLLSGRPADYLKRRRSRLAFAQWAEITRAVRTSILAKARRETAAREKEKEREKELEKGLVEPVLLVADKPRVANARPRSPRRVVERSLLEASMTPLIQQRCAWGLKWRGDLPCT